MKQPMNVQSLATPKKNLTWFRAMTLLALPLFWIGYAHALYTGDAVNQLSYPLPIIAFSLMNADVLFGKKTLPNIFLNGLAKANGLLIIGWALVEMVLLLLK